MKVKFLLFLVSLVALAGLIPFGHGLLPGNGASAHQADCDTLDPAALFVGGECYLNSAIVKNGTFAVGHTLHIGPTGKITSNVAPGLTLNITGDLIIDTPAGATGTNGISAEVVNTNGLKINIDATGSMTLHGNGTKGARITASRTGTGAGGDGGGDITITVGARDAVTGFCVAPQPAGAGEITMAFGSQVLANTPVKGAGDIVMNACKAMDIDGLVESKSLQSGVPNQPPGGGPITLDAGCNILISDTGKVSSEGRDPGSDLVHLGAGCEVKIWGLVQSIGVGHSQPVNPHNHCDNTNHLDKPANATGCVEVWAGDSLIVDSLNHKGEVNADKIGQCGNGKVSWIDLFARGDIQIIGDTVAPYAVHANSCGASDQPGGIITVMSTEGKVTASKLAFSASGATSNGGDGGTITVQAQKDVNLDTASLIASGHVTAALGVGGKINVQSFNQLVTWQNGIGDVRPNATGTITIVACTTINDAGTNFNGEIPSETPGSCAAGPFPPAYVVLPKCACECPEDSA